MRDGRGGIAEGLQPQTPQHHAVPTHHTGHLRQGRIPREGCVNGWLAATPHVAASRQQTAPPTCVVSRRQAGHAERECHRHEPPLRADPVSQDLTRPPAVFRPRGPARFMRAGILTASMPSFSAFPALASPCSLGLGWPAAPTGSGAGQWLRHRPEVRSPSLAPRVPRVDAPDADRTVPGAHRFHPSILLSPPARSSICNIAHAVSRGRQPG